MTTTISSSTVPTMTGIVRPETTDQLGRILPAITLADVMSREATPRHVQECLAMASAYGRNREYNELVKWAAGRGVTHGPEDLAGRRCRFAYRGDPDAEFSDAPCRGADAGCSCGAPGCVDYSPADATR